MRTGQVLNEQLLKNSIKVALVGPTKCVRCSQKESALKQYKRNQSTAVHAGCGAQSAGVIRADSHRIGRFNHRYLPVPVRVEYNSVYREFNIVREVVCLL